VLTLVSTHVRSLMAVNISKPKYDYMRHNLFFAINCKPQFPIHITDELFGESY
jgi:hypothetical protein